MTTQIGIGFSQHKDGMIAAQEAAQQAKTQLNKERIDFAILFNSVHYSPEEILPVVFKALDQTKLIGCSTAGIILSERTETQGLGILAFHSDNIVFETGSITHLDLQDLTEAGQSFGQNAVSDWGQEHRKLFLFFVDGLINNITSLTAGLQGKLGQFFPILGAGSIDDLQFQRTYQYQKEKYFSLGAAGVILGGKPMLAFSGKHGWKPLGKPRIVNDSQGHIIKTIDQKSAYTLYKDYFDEEAQTLRANRLGQINIHYPLGISTETSHEYAIRNVVRVLDDESIVCQDNVRKGSTTHIMIGNKETSLLAAEQAATELKDQLGLLKPSVIIILESIYRYKLLGKAAREEMKLIKKIVGEDIPLFGMYSHGEVYPLKASANHVETIVNNGSIVLLAIA